MEKSTNTSLDDMALFVEVARRKNFSRASESSGVPVSTLSRRITGLERCIGVKLLHRSTRRVELTEAGSVYFERCRNIIDKARIAHEQLVEAARRPQGRLRVAVPTSLAVMSLSEILRDFCTQYPEIECEFDLSMRQVDLLIEPYDMALRLGEQPDSGVVSRHLDDVHMGLYASSDYLARQGVPREPADLEHHVCLRRSTAKADAIWRLRCQGRQEPVPVSGAVAANDSGMLRRLCLHGMGIAPLTEYLSRCDEGVQRLVRVLPGWDMGPMPLFALFPSRLVPAKVRVFIDFLQDRLPALRAAREASLRNDEAAVVADAAGGASFSANRP